MSEPAFEQWAALELMGHRRRYGLCKEVEIAGAKMMRVDIPYESGDVSEFYGASVIYSILPCEEEMCRNAVKHDDPRPVKPVQYKSHDDQNDDGSFNRVSVLIDSNLTTPQIVREAMLDASDGIPF